MQRILKQLKGSTGATLSLDALEPLHIHGWLLDDDDDDKEWVSDITAKVLARADKTSMASGSSKAGASSAAKPKAASTDVAGAMSMFSSRKWVRALRARSPQAARRGGARGAEPPSRALCRRRRASLSLVAPARAAVGYDSPVWNSGLACMQNYVGPWMRMRAPIYICIHIICVRLGRYYY